MTEESRTANKGFCNIGADGITMCICNYIWLQFLLTNIYRLLYLTSTLYFQSAAVLGTRNSISQPAQSPALWWQYKKYFYT